MASVPNSYPTRPARRGGPNTSCFNPEAFLILPNIEIPGAYDLIHRDLEPRTVTPEDCECEGCGIGWPDSDCEYHYCVRITSQRPERDL